MRTTVLIIPLALTVLACELGPEPPRLSGPPPPAAAMVAPGQGADLLEQLRVLEAEIDLALEGEAAHILTAEAITDQLLHAPRRVDWLGTGYSVEARIRQIQAMADGTVARLRRGSSVAALEPELELLKAAVQDLRHQLALPGGGPAPPSLETLLAQDPLRDARVPVGGAAGGAAARPPAGPQPLGTPVSPAD
jgi:hypothetical protein